jgi:hypothetical protein
MLLGFEIGQRWPEAVMHSCGSYFVPVPKDRKGIAGALAVGQEPRSWYRDMPEKTAVTHRLAV